MSYAVKRAVDPSGTGSSGPEAPPTATVLDFICLFTHDLRRKQKRWQDGRLKYHTFNKRVMVYDDRGNFIGDAHWQEGGDLTEGDELELDRGAAIVQVAECTGSREQDLTELLDKRAREIEKRRAMAAARTPGRTAANSAAQRPDGQAPILLQRNHRALSAIVPHSPGPIGRAAIPSHSPFEARLARSGEEREAKRRRTDKSPPSKAGYARSLFGATLTLSQSPIGRTVAAKATVLREKTNVLERRGEENKRKNEVETNDDIIVLDGPPRAPVTTEKSTHATTTPDIEAVTADIETTSAIAGSGAFSKATKPAASAKKSIANVQQQPTYEQHRGIEQASSLSRVSPRILERQNTIDETDESLKPATKDRRPPSPKGSIDVEKSAPEGGEALEPPELAKHSSTCKKPMPAHGEKSAQPQSREEKEPFPLEKPEPRTELRIRSRQRRGLLMVSEKRQQHQQQQQGQSQRRSETPCSSEASIQTGAIPGQRDTERHCRRRAELDEPKTMDRTLQPPTPDAPSHVDPVAVSGSESEAPLRRTRKPHPSSGHEFDDLSSESDAPPANGRRNNKRSAARARVPDPNTQSDDSPPSRKSRRRRSPTDLTSDEESDNLPSLPRKRTTREKTRKGPSSAAQTEEPGPSRPRLAKLARKSLKSREIFGFIPPTDLVPAPFATATNRIGLQGQAVAQAAEAPPANSGAISHVAKAHVPATKRGCSPAVAAQPLERGCDVVDKTLVNSSAVSTKPCPAAPTTIAPRIHADSSKEHVDVEAAEALGPSPVLLDSYSGHAAVKTAATGGAQCAHTPTDPPMAATTTEKDPSPHMNPPGPSRASTSDTVAKPMISNPATRGKKAATKQHAAGQAPQSLVPMEPTAPVRTTPTAPAQPKRQGANMPGFSTANGGAWSKHAEDLLGMGRPTKGKR